MSKDYRPSKDDDTSPEEKRKEHERLMKEFLAKGGKIERIPYGVTNMEMGRGNSNNFYDPPETITPKTWRTRKTRAKNKKPTK